MARILHCKLKILFLLVTGICLFTLITQKAFGQEKTSPKSDEYIYPNPQNLDELAFYGIVANNCEYTRVNLEKVIDEANKKKDSYLIIIIRLERGERAGLYQLRQKNMQKWLDGRYEGNWTSRFLH